MRAPASAGRWTTGSTEDAGTVPPVRHPFETWPPTGRRAWAWTLTVAFLAIVVTFQILGRELDEGGLVGLQLARSHERVGEIISAWEADGALGYGAFSLGLDMAFPVVYGLLLSVAASAVARRARERGASALVTAATAVAWLGWVAGLLDLTENAFQVPYFRDPAGSIPALVATLATAKYACLVVAIGVTLTGWIMNRAASPEAAPA